MSLLLVRMSLAEFLDVAIAEVDVRWYRALGLKNFVFIVITRATLWLFLLEEFGILRVGTLGLVIESEVPFLLALCNLLFVTDLVVSGHFLIGSLFFLAHGPPFSASLLESISSFEIRILLSNFLYVWSIEEHVRCSCFLWRGTFILWGSRLVDGHLLGLLFCGLFDCRFVSFYARIS
jgi:hypothetical protein